MAKTQPIGDWIRNNRIANEMTQDELAIQLGCSGMTVSNMERGKRDPDADDMRKLQKLFGSAAEQSPLLEEDSFGAWLRRELKRRNMTLQELSDKSGVTMTTISLIQTGKIQRPQRKTIDKIEGVLKAGPKVKDQAPPEEPPELSSTTSEKLAIGVWQDFVIEDVDSWPTSPGVYILYDVSKRPTYVGKSQNIRNRLREHKRQKWWVDETVVTAAYIEVKDVNLRSRLEEILITFANGNILVNKNLVERD